jgi:hypothetical protein
MQSEDGEPRLVFPQIEVTELTDVFQTNPRLLFSGSANKHNVNFENISLTDTLSFLQGSGTFLWKEHENTDILNSARFAMKLENPLSNEEYDFNFTVENPNEKAFSLQTFRDDYYFLGTALVTSFPAGRLIGNQNSENTISGNFALSGTFNNPYITARITNASLMAGAVPVQASGIATFSEQMLQLSGVTATAGRNTLRNFALQFSLNTFSGMADALYTLNLGTASVSAPVRLTLTSEKSPDEKIPKNYVVSVTSTGFTSELFDKPKPLAMSIVRTDGRFDIYTVNTRTVSGWLLDSGDAFLNVSGESPVQFEMNGSIRQEALNLDVQNLAINLSAFSKLLSFPAIAVYTANITGNVHIGGTMRNPDFSGLLHGAAIDLNVPNYVQEHLLANTASFTIESSRLFSDDSIRFRSNSANVLLDLELFMNGWKFEQLVLGIKTAPNSFQRAHIDLPRMEISGFGECDLNIDLVPTSVTLTGSIHAQNGSLAIETLQTENINIFASRVQPAPAKASRMANIVNLSITAGNRVQISVNSPIITLRGLITPGTELAVRFDSEADTVDLLGDILLRSGQIEYFNRTFYLLSNTSSPPRIVFDENTDSIDPLLSVRAEIRESDENGEQVRITMQATNQRFSDFTASFTASPPKSEAEIMSLLGQIFIGNNENGVQFLIGGGTSFVQNYLFHTIEDGLRDLLKFDIFSIRTMAFQNILENRLDVAGLRKPLTAGNIFNNSTVYIGKSFGSSIYFDTLVHFLYDETKELVDPKSNGIIFQPEIGLEMSAPFANIRMSLSPEIGGDEFSVISAFVSAASLTVSWKFSF